MSVFVGLLAEQTKQKSSPLAGVIFVVVLVGVVAWLGFTESGRSFRRWYGEYREQHKKPTPTSKTKISQVGTRSDAGLACPKCGGTQFKAKRSAAGKAVGVATVGVGAVLVPKHRVKCVTCGTEYKRG